MLLGKNHINAFKFSKVTELLTVMKETRPKC